MLNFKSNIILAPLAGFTDCAFRRLCTDCGAGLTVTEMVSAKGLHYQNANTKILLKTAGESPVSAQIFGNDPHIMAEACQSEALSKFDCIDINMGCPVPKIVKNFEGSALLNDINLAEKVISTCVKSTTKPISVKFRLGFKLDEDICIDFAKMCENAGASFITIHGRTREQYYSGQAKFDNIFKAADSIKIPVFANGDIASIDDYNFIMNNSNVYGVAIGRGALGNPAIFNELLGKPYLDKASLILKHYDYLKANFDEHYISTNLKKHLCYYIDGIDNAKYIRNQIFTSKDIDSAINIAIKAIKENTK